jgi:hypothetical protein
MILVGPNLDELDLITLGNFQTYIFQHFIHVVIKYRSPIFGWKYKMVQQDRYVVALPN